MWITRGTIDINRLNPLCLSTIKNKLGIKKSYPLYFLSLWITFKHLMNKLSTDSNYLWKTFQ
ncbi:hypothetical protein CDIMF43_80042 [Carnobacterium divergens]|nr:hypothetical protein CDIMF43_80042 [Carnobacterium divergens]